MADLSHGLGLRFTGRLRGQALVVALSGDLTGSGGDCLLETLGREPWRTAKTVVVDLSGVARLDRRGVRTLLDAHVAVLLRLGTMTITGASAAVRTALVASGGSSSLVESDSAAAAAGVHG